MLDSKIVDLAAKKIRVEGDRLNRLQRENIKGIESNMAARNMLSSGITLRKMTDEYCESIDRYAKMSWGVFLRIFDEVEMDFSASLHNDLEQEITKNVNAYTKHQVQSLSRMAGMHHLQDSLSPNEKRIGQAKDESNRWVLCELDLYIHALEARAEKESKLDSKPELNLQGEVPPVLRYIKWAWDNKGRYWYLAILVLLIVFVPALRWGLAYIHEENTQTEEPVVNNAIRVAFLNKITADVELTVHFKVIPERVPAASSKFGDSERANDRLMSAVKSNLIIELEKRNLADARAAKKEIALLVIEACREDMLLTAYQIEEIHINEISVVP